MIGSINEVMMKIGSPQAEHLAKSTISRSDIARAFLRLADFYGVVFERLGRYETSLWRHSVTNYSPAKFN
jgi:hypothetical protein